MNLGHQDSWRSGTDPLCKEEANLAFNLLRLKCKAWCANTDSYTGLDAFHTDTLLHSISNITALN